MTPEQIENAQRFFREWNKANSTSSYRSQSHSGYTGWADPVTTHEDEPEFSQSQQSPFDAGAAIPNDDMSRHHESPPPSHDASPHTSRKNGSSPQPAPKIFYGRVSVSQDTQTTPPERPVFYGRCQPTPLPQSSSERPVFYGRCRPNPNVRTAVRQAPSLQLFGDTAGMWKARLLSHQVVSEDLLNHPMLQNRVINFVELDRLLNYLRLLNKKINSLWQLAALTGHVAAVMQDISDPMSTPYDVQGWSPLHYAALAGNDELFNRLRNTVTHCGYDSALSSREGFTILHALALGGYTDFLYAKAGEFSKVRLSDKDSEKRNIFHFAALGGHAALCISIMDEKKYLKLSAKAFNGWRAHHFAAKGGNPQVLLALWQHKNVNFDFNEQPKYGGTPLIIAVENRCEAAVSCLLDEIHVNPRVEDEKGRSLMHAVGVAGNLRLLEALNTRGFALQAVDKYGTNPFHVAAEAGNIDFILEVKQRFPHLDLTLADKAGSTMLGYAAMGDKADVLHALVTHFDLDVLEVRREPKKKGKKSKSKSLLKLAHEEATIKVIQDLMVDAIKSKPIEKDTKAQWKKWKSSRSPQQNVVSILKGYCNKGRKLSRHNQSEVETAYQAIASTEPGPEVLKQKLEELLMNILERGVDKVNLEGDAITRIKFCLLRVDEVLKQNNEVRTELSHN